jgi:hypothetical protein
MKRATEHCGVQFISLVHILQNEDIACGLLDCGADAI